MVIRQITQASEDGARWRTLVRGAALAANHHSWWDRERRRRNNIIKGFVNICQRPTFLISTLPQITPYNQHHHHRRRYRRRRCHAVDASVSLQFNGCSISMIQGCLHVLP